MNALKMEKENKRKSGKEILKEFYPEMYGLKFRLIQILYFMFLIIVVFCIIRIHWFLPIIIQIVIGFIVPIASLGMASKNADKIRDNYRNKYRDKAYPKFVNRYLSWMMVPAAISYVIIVIIYSKNFFSPLYNFEDNPFYIALLPWQISFIIGILLLIFVGFLARTSINGGFDRDTEMFLYIIYPEKARKVEGGVYNYVRHAHYAQGAYLAIALAFFANNIMGFLLALIFILGYYSVGLIEDRELIHRYGAKHKEFMKNKPAFFPKVKDWKNYFKLIFTGN